MKSSHNVIESNKNPKRKLTGEAAILKGGKPVQCGKTEEIQSSSRNSARGDTRTVLSQWRNSIQQRESQDKNPRKGKEQ